MLGPVRDSCFHFGVDRPRAADNPTGVNDAFQNGFPTRRCLAGENDSADAVRPKNSPTFAKGFGQFALVKLATSFDRRCSARVDGQRRFLRLSQQLLP